jgi:hypothetical protein
VRLEASTKPHVHQNFEIFWINIASTMACPNFKNGPKIGLCPLEVKVCYLITQIDEVLLHNILEPVLGRPFGYNANHCRKSL